MMSRGAHAIPTDLRTVKVLGYDLSDSVTTNTDSAEGGMDGRGDGDMI